MKDIEQTKNIFEEQILSDYHYQLTKTALIRLRGLKPERQRIYQELEALDELSIKHYKGILNLCMNAVRYEQGDYDAGAFNKKIKLYKDAKNRIQKYVEKQNAWLLKNDRYFEFFPVQVSIGDHHLDIPTKKHPQTKGKAMLIGGLSYFLKPYIKEEPTRGKLIGKILTAFGGFLESECRPRNIRKHF